MAKVNYRNKWIWFLVRILLICVIATSVAYLSRLDLFMLDDVGAISLISEAQLIDDADNVSADNSLCSADSSSCLSSDTDNLAGDKPADTSLTDITSTPSSDCSLDLDASLSSDAPSELPDELLTSNSNSNSNSNSTVKPGFVVSDDNTVWSTQTQVEIFKISYENGEQVVTVNSDNGDKLIAPGTENSYTFKLKNTGNVALDYSVDLEAFFSPAEIELPISCRLNRYDGKWIVGSQDAFASVPELDLAEDHASLGAGKYTYYTLEWCWPFESGDDLYDTFLGNLATEQDLCFTVVINTSASYCYDPSDDSGITPPQTGDSFNLIFWVLVAAAAFIIMLITLFYQGKDNSYYSSEAD